MKSRLVLLCLIALASARTHAEIDPSTASWVGQKVWHNECDGTVEGLVSWNAGEQFASLGIGHFIWYPAGQKGPFEESFPTLITQLAAAGIAIPDWTRGPCPWNSRAEFMTAAGSARVRELRALLARTVPQQTAALVARMEAALPKLLAAAPSGDRTAIEARFKALRGTREGTFALIDYVNFKGEGTLASERYQGQGWGLLQVLQGMRGNPNGAAATAEFARAALEVLKQRVQNAPPARNEARWLPGWSARVRAYAG